MLLFITKSSKFYSIDFYFNNDYDYKICWKRVVFYDSILFSLYKFSSYDIILGYFCIGFDEGLIAINVGLIGIYVGLNVN